MIAALLLTALLAPTAAPDGADALLSSLSPALTAAEARRTLTSLGARELHFRRASEPQALADGLVRSRLLETINRLGLAPTRSAKDAALGDPGLDRAAFEEVATFVLGGRSWTLTFGRPRGGRRDGSAAVLRFALVRVPAPIDGPPSAPGRLHPLRDALEALKRSGLALRVQTRDPWGNVTGWTGAGPRGGTAYALHQPEEDELRVLLAM